MYSCEDYLNKKVFDPITYLHENYNDLGSETVLKLCMKNLLDCLHNTLSSGHFGGDRFADICSGPCVFGAISASKYFKDVYLTEYAPQSRQYLKEWLHEHNNEFDWTKHFQYAAELEGRFAQDIENRIRKSIRGILACDLLMDDPFEEGWSSRILPLDGIISSFTLEVVMQDKTSYESILHKFYSYLRPQGGLFLFGELNSSSYNIGGNKMAHLSVDIDFVVQAVESAGFQIIEKHVFDYEPEGVKDKYTIGEGEQYYYIAATK